MWKDLLTFTTLLGVFSIMLLAFSVYKIRADKKRYLPITNDITDGQKAFILKCLHNIAFSEGVSPSVFGDIEQKIRYNKYNELSNDEIDSINRVLDGYCINLLGIIKIK